MPARVPTGETAVAKWHQVPALRGLTGSFMGKRDPPPGRHLSFPLPAQRCRRRREGEAARLRSGAAKLAGVAEAGGEDGGRAHLLTTFFTGLFTGRSRCCRERCPVRCRIYSTNIYLIPSPRHRDWLSILFSSSFIPFLSQTHPNGLKKKKKCGFSRVNKVVLCTWSLFFLTFSLSVTATQQRHKPEV